MIGIMPRAIGLTALVLLIVTGCGGDSRQQAVYPVTGEITYDGKPL